MAKRTSVEVGDIDTTRSGLDSIVTDPFGASMMTGKPSSTASKVVVVAGGTVVVTSDNTLDVVVSVERGTVSPASVEPHAPPISAPATRNGMSLRIMDISSLWRRTDHNVRPLLRRLAAHRQRGDLATSRGGSQLRDSAGISPDFARCRYPG
jgi:hypothetical protein